MRMLAVAASVVAVVSLVLAMLAMRQNERLTVRVDELERTRLYTDVFLRQVERDIAEHNELRDRTYEVQRMIER